MTIPKSRYSNDPFLTAVAEQPRQRLLTRSQAAGFLGIGLTTLDEWRSRKLPPPFVDLRGMVRYKCGDVMDFVDSLPTSQLTAPTTAVAVPTQPVPADDLQRIGMYAPVMRGGRRRKVGVSPTGIDALEVPSPIVSLNTWLTHAASDCPWRFLLLPTSAGDCPIDLLATLGMDEDDVPDWAEWVPLTLAEYAARLDRHARAIWFLEREREISRLPQSEDSMEPPRLIVKKKDDGGRL